MRKDGRKQENFKEGKASKETISFSKRLSYM
jgi:hypothetical protein